MYYVVGSAGHGLWTLGKRTHAFADGSYMIEYEHNRAVFNELMRLLKLDYRFSVLDTSPVDDDESINLRTKRANDFKKKNSIPRNRIVYISDHANADSSIKWSPSNGCEVLHYPGSIEGERFAKAITAEMSKILGLRDRGAIPRTNLGILNKTNMPAVITEAAFMTNFEEAKKLMSHDFRMKEAYSIYRGLCIGFGIPILIQEKREENVELIFNPNQDIDVIISTKKPLNINQILEIVNAAPTKKMYTVTEIQNEFNGLGYYCGDADGSKGPKTTAAIKAFQRLNKLEETGNMDSESIACMERIKKSNDPYRTMWFNDSEVHVYTGSLEDHEVGVGLGQYGKLEKLSEMASQYTCAINGQFFGGGREGLGTLILKGLYYFKPVNDKFKNWIQYKNGSSEIRDIKDSELWLLQRDSVFTIGTSWALIVKGGIVKILSGGIAHKFFKHPRTLMADTLDKLMSFIVIDGRRKTSKGMTAKQCQELLKYIEMVLKIKYENATNLDGGGSSEMMINGVIVNTPSEGIERKIGTYLYLM